jgi:hypothetical protein
VDAQSDSRPAYCCDTIRANFPTLGIVEKGKVAALKPQAR